MIAIESQTSRSVLFGGIINVVCPLCGDRMRKMKSFQGTDEQLAWFECVRKNCPGWLVQAQGAFPSEAEQMHV